MKNMGNKTQNGFAPVVIVVIVGIALVVAAITYFVFIKPDNASPQSPEGAAEESVAESEEMDMRLSIVAGSEKLLLSVGGDGGYADPSVIEIEPGRYLMYLNRFGSAFGFNDQGIFAMESSDMMRWSEKTSILFPNIAVGRAVKMDGGVRFYYPTTQPLGPDDPPSVLRSAFSSDGISFVDEAGARLEPSAGNYMEGVTLIKPDDGLWHMYFTESGVEDSWQHHSTAIYRATSEDGLAWNREDAPVLEVEGGVEGLMPWPQILRPSVVERPEGGYWMFYNSHNIVYYAFSDDGTSWKKMGRLLASGSDVDGIYDKDDNLRLYVGQRTEAEGSTIHTVLVEE